MAGQLLSLLFITGFLRRGWRGFCFPRHRAAKPARRDAGRGRAQREREEHGAFLASEARCAERTSGPERAERPRRGGLKPTRAKRGRPLPATAPDGREHGSTRGREALRASAVVGEAGRDAEEVSMATGGCFFRPAVRTTTSPYSLFFIYGSL